MKRFYLWLVHQSVPHLIRVACFAALIALSSMAYSVISLKPLPVIFAMSVGHGIGIFAFLLYLLAVILDTQRRGTRDDAAPNSGAVADSDTPADSDTATDSDAAATSGSGIQQGSAEADDAPSAEGSDPEIRTA